MDFINRIFHGTGRSQSRSSVNNQPPPNPPEAQQTATMNSASNMRENISTPVVLAQINNSTPTKESILNAWVEAAPTADEKVLRQELRNTHFQEATLNVEGQLTITGDLDLRRNIGLTTLPEGLTVGGILNLGRCTSLTALPKGLVVGGYLNLYGCTDLTTLPEGLIVRGRLNCRDCTDLTTLPQGLIIRGDLNLDRCIGLITLPVEITIGGDLSLGGCTGLRALPEGLTIGKALYLSGCIGLTTLPERLTVDGDLDLDDCTNLTALPNSIATLGSRDNRTARTVNLTGSGLSEAVLHQIQLRQEAGEFPGTRFIFGHAAQAHQSFTTIEQVLYSWGFEPNAINSADWNLTPAQTQQLITFLSRLHNTADAKNIHTKPHLQYRIHAFLNQMQANANDFRAQTLEQIGQALESCDDRVILIMDNIEILTRIREAEGADHPDIALITLAKSLVGLEVVHRHAQAKCERSHFVDPIEVYLALQVRLAQELQLPVSTQKMLFERCANLTSDEIEFAKTDACLAMKNPDTLVNYLNQWDPWQRYQRTQQVKDVIWNASLSHSSEQFIVGESCVISGKTLGEDLTDPVAVELNLYSFESLMKWWTKEGTDPVTRSKIELADIRTVQL